MTFAVGTQGRHVRHSPLYIDWSAFLAVADCGHPRHGEAERVFRAALPGDGGRVGLVTSRFDLLQATDKLQRSLGFIPARDLYRLLLPYLGVLEIGPRIYQEALAAWQGDPTSHAPLVVHLVVQLMRSAELSVVFTMDREVYGGLGLDGLP